LTENDDTATDRRLVLEYLERQLVGPIGADDELLGEQPHRRYLTGILFPSEADADIELAEDIQDETPGEVTGRLGEDQGDEPIALTGQRLPSAVGVSFVLPSWSPVRAEITAARYGKQDDGWRRSPIQLAGEQAITLAPPSRPGRTQALILDSSASLDVVWREFGAGALVTVALVNRRRMSGEGGVDPADCLLQVNLRCFPAEGLIPPYPSSLSIQSDEEEEELALLYRNVPTFAVGHGAAAVWGKEEAGQRVSWVGTSYLPSYAIPSVRFELPHAGNVLSLLRLSHIDTDTSVIRDLDRFLDQYDAWAEELKAIAVGIQPRLASAAARLLGRISDASLRMRRGVRLLESDEHPEVRRAFAMANRAMLMQMVHTGEDFSGRRKLWTDSLPAARDYDDTSRVWRPFQLAFLLLTIESVALDESPDRDLVDLIWFPTGGGKTEAYLGLVAFTIFHRRLVRWDAGAGTTIITRYTLRLLTAQQFQRAATLVCACELIRRESPDILGGRPISIGIWIGGGNSPNTYSQAVALLEQIKNKEWTSVSFQVDLCPWCGTEIIPEGDAPAEAYAVHPANDSFRMACANPECDFRDHLPVSSVDEDLYDNPPTVLIGTVDKFARLTWEGRAGVFLGTDGDPGPSLVIQDELHLISGPLGTIVGLYEAAFDVVMRRHGARPKIVASTATIRRAEEQVLGVFARKVVMFPPSGVDADDSYFVKFDRDKPGRLYCGVMPQGHTPLTAMVHLSAALLQGPWEIPLTPPADDAYWTLVAYHNNLRELGKSVTLAHDDIPARMSVIAEAEDDVRPLHDNEILELTSNVPAAEIPGRLELLQRRRGEKGAVSFVASTNMISVGVDVPRLGLMLVSGQPKTTSEYIQATSRVGRGKVDGLVVTMFSPSRPRDRSHYESFVPYHSALYRAVEPTSVTPFAIPARNRALHAGLVVMARHARGWEPNDAASLFTAADTEWRELVTSFLERVARSEPDETQDVKRHLRELEARWAELALASEESGGLRYSTSGGREHIGLLRRFGETGKGWETLDSMRNIDMQVSLRVRGED
jgi:hypothetical protein